jgi:hypothetical protein
VRLITPRVTHNSFLERKPISERLIKAKFNFAFAKRTDMVALAKRTYMVCYASTEDAEDVENGIFYYKLQ